MIGSSSIAMDASSEDDGGINNNHIDPNSNIFFTISNINNNNSHSHSTDVLFNVLWRR